jgi:hypothetical protein
MNTKKHSPIAYINLAFSMVMVLVTLFGSFIFLFTDLLMENASGYRRTILGIVFLAYAIYRGYRIYKSLEKN